MNFLTHGAKKTMAAGLVAAMVAGVTASVSASAAGEAAFPSIRIKNFGRMDDHFYRGAQPGEGDFKALKGLGIKTVVDLRNDPEPYEKRDTEAAGMRYVNIPMSDSKTPDDKEIQAFLKIANDPSCWPFYVHCAGGRHRTGVMGAVYRMNHDKWDVAQAYSEMKQYDFYTHGGHGPLKHYVFDYPQRKN
jgi:tyrosine-protein phosphatase SIW14